MVIVVFNSLTPCHRVRGFCLFSIRLHTAYAHIYAFRLHVAETDVLLLGNLWQELKDKLREDKKYQFFNSLTALRDRINKPMRHPQDNTVYIRVFAYMSETQIF